MVYESEAVLPVGLAFEAPRLAFKDVAETKATRLEEIGMLEEERLNIVIQLARYQQTLRRYHDRAVRFRAFSVEDLMLRKVIYGEGRHKISPSCEGSYIITEVTRPRSYGLSQTDGTLVGNSWNIEHLRKCYP